MNFLKLLSILLSLLGTRGIPSSLKTMTLFRQTTSWIGAHFICQTTGGRLLKISNDKEKDVVTSFLKADPWRQITEHSFVWVGLHVDEDSKYYWDDCSRYDGLLASGNTNDNRCVELSTGIIYGNLDVLDCSESRKFICEYVGVREGICNFEENSNTKAKDLDSVMITKDNAADCTRICSTAIRSNMECWAVTWVQSVRQCHLHFTTDSAYYSSTINRQRSTTSTLFTKFCYKANLDTSDIPGYDLNSLKAVPSCLNISAPGNATVYTLFTVPKTWHEARDTCAAIGQQLFVLRNLSDQTNLERLFGTTVPRFWIGLFDLSNTVTWVAGKTSTLTSWAPGEPSSRSDSKCVYTNTTTYTWFATACDLNLPYVCQMTNGSCSYEILDNVRGPLIKEKWSIGITYLSINTCRSDCQSQSQCRGFSYNSGFVGKKCYLHISTDRNYLFNRTHLTDDKSYKLHRITCAYGITSGITPLSRKPEPLIIGHDVTGDVQPSPNSDSDVRPVQTTDSTSSHISPSTLDSVPASSSRVSASSAIFSSAVYFSSVVPDYNNLILSTDSLLIEPSLIVLSSSASATPSSSSTTPETPPIPSSVTPGTPRPPPSSSVTPGTPRPPPSSSVTPGTPRPPPSSSVTPRPPPSSSVTPGTPRPPPSSSVTPGTPRPPPSSSSSPISASSSSATSIAPSSSITLPSTSSMTLPPTSSITTSSVVPSSSVTPTTTPYSCACRCKLNFSTARTNELITEIKKKLLVKPKSTSKALRTKTSAKDSRPSAQTAGYAAILFLSLTIIGLFLLDSVTLVYQIKYLVKKLFP